MYVFVACGTERIPLLGDPRLLAATSGELLLELEQEEGQGEIVEGQSGMVSSRYVLWFAFNVGCEVDQGVV